MTQTTPKIPPLVQLYDKERVREYTKTHHGFIFSYTEVVRTEKLESELVLFMLNDKMPDKVFFNGKEHKLTPLK